MTRLIFGEVTREEAEGLVREGKVAGDSPNPAVNEYGPGPEGRTCGECVHLVGFQYSKTYYKCEAWKMSHSAATDFRKKWPACQRFYFGEGKHVAMPKP